MATPAPILVEAAPEALPWRRALVVVQAIGLMISTLAILSSESRLINNDAANLLIAAGIYGYLFAQTVIAAIATVFGRGPLFLRLAIPPLLLAVQIVLQLALTIHKTGEQGIVFLGALLAFIIWSIVQLPLWVIRYGLRLRVIAGSNDTSASSPEQFTIKQILLFTLAVAVVLGLGRVMLDDDLVIEASAMDIQVAIGAGLILAGIVSVAMTTTYFSLLRGLLIPRLAIGMSVALVIAVTVALGWVTVFEPSRLVDNLFIPVCLLWQHVWTSLNLLRLRNAGYRLVRTG